MTTLDQPTAERVQPVHGHLAVVVPSTGASPWLAEALAALRSDGGPTLSRVVVWQGEAAAPTLDPVDRLLMLPAPVGFAAAVNRGLVACATELVAVVNDDAVIAPGWFAALGAVLAADRRVAAVQGVNLDPAERVDGCGIGWNRWLQAIQLRRGEVAPAAADPLRAVFGVSATAALYRRSALDAVALPGEGVFDPRLDSYYEDVDLGVRLRAAGWRSACVPAARVRHLGSATGGRNRRRLSYLLHRNRWWVLWRALGPRLGRQLPRLLLRDGLDLARGLAAGAGGEALAGAGGTAHGLAGLGTLRRHPPRLGCGLDAWVER